MPDWRAVFVLLVAYLDFFNFFRWLFLLASSQRIAGIFFLLLFFGLAFGLRLYLSLLDGVWVGIFSHFYASVKLQLALELHEHKPPKPFVVLQLMKQLFVVHAIAEL